jgi:hypothetical protein
LRYTNRIVKAEKEIYTRNGGMPKGNQNISKKNDGEKEDKRRAKKEKNKK